MSDSFFEVEYRPGKEVILRFKSPSVRVLSDTTKEHLSASGREMLLALRSMLDKAIEGTEESSKSKGRKKTKIEVQ